MAIALQALCRGLSTGEIDKDNGATSRAPFCCFRAALTNKVFSPTPTPNSHTLSSHTILPLPLPPTTHHPGSAVAPPQSLSSVLLFSHHLYLIAFPSTYVRSTIHDLLHSAVPLLRLDHLIPCTSLSSPCTLLCPEVFPVINESGKEFQHQLPAAYQLPRHADATSTSHELISAV